MPGWRSDADIVNGEVHIWPEDDLVPHLLTGAGCLCGPWLEEQGNGTTMITHHSLDGRELEEHNA